MIFVMALLGDLDDCRWRAQLVAAPAGAGHQDPTAARLGLLRKRVALLARVDLALGVLVVPLGVMLARMEACPAG
ncbi:MAG TPA: hypothetical protein VIG69_10305 [Candidatus Methylomirabilis sp.]|jgi:hypothetical protein